MTAAVDPDRTGRQNANGTATVMTTTMDVATGTANECTQYALEGTPSNHFSLKCLYAKCESN